jgi:predicted phosphoserine aminotransferase
MGGGAADHKVLFSPGPTEVAPEILRQMSRPLIGHRGPEMQELVADLLPRVRALFATANHDVFLTACSGTGLHEAAIRNCAGRRVLVPVCGAFSERFHQVAVACGVEADPLAIEWGLAVRPGQVEERLETGRYDAVALVHNETSTGVVNPLAEIAAVVRRHRDVLLLVDCVSSLGGMPVEVDRNGIDVALASVQKCLALPPGFSLCAVSPRALERSRATPGKGYYFDFVRLKAAYDRRLPLATPSISHMFALQAQLARIEAEGYAARFARHTAMAERTRDWAERRFALFAEAGARSDSVTCVRNSRGISVADLAAAVAARGYALSNGYGRLKEATFRIGHMGEHTVEGVGAFLAAVDEALERAGR